VCSDANILIAIAERIDSEFTAANKGIDDDEGREREREMGVAGLSSSLEF
jgi:hypothetical protein